MTDTQLDQLFEEYWRTRPDRGWHSQFEEKYEAARAAFLAGYKLAFSTGLLAEPSCPRCGAKYTRFSGCSCAL